ncbi:CoA pyrophosphatase [Salaquimonas pukyongi]|uniref:CoA pyrophosphatase n=1 Tax=Salaquimonas pukyongi TaxID=2712698 RepID=UPI0009F97D2A|nr:CoA pyrophosphatase [Salaquimonas pukyongi]
MQTLPDSKNLDAEGFRQLAGKRLFAPATEPIGDFAINPEFRNWVLKQATRPAAVLIPVVDGGDALSVILTKRTEKLASHSGQVAFPGGKIDAEDGGPVEAALREANEEIGLDSAEVDVLGVMPEYLTGSGFRISPVVGLVAEKPSLAPNHDEVEYIFDVPLAFLLDTANHRVGSRMFQGKRRHYLEMPYGEHYIWGVTAGIIKHFQERLTGGGSSRWSN